MKLKLFYALFISASMLLVGCTESETDDPIVDEPTVEEPTTPEEVTPTGISLSDTAITLTINEIHTLTATLSPSDAEGSITWSTSDSSVATVSSGGAVMALAAGSANIVATCDDLTATCVVTVEEEEDNGEDNGEEEDTDNIFLYAFGYGPNGEVAQEGVEGVEGSATAYSMTNSAVQTNAWDTQFCIAFGYDYDDDGVVDQGIVSGQTYRVSMSVKTDGENVSLSPSINNEGSYLTTLSAYLETSSSWKDFIFEFEGDSSNVDGNRLTFSIGDKVTTLYVDEITIIEVSDDGGSDEEGWVEKFANGNLESDFNTLTGWTYGDECSMGYTEDGGYDNSRGYYFTNGVIRDENWQGQIQIQYSSSIIREPESGATDNYLLSLKARADSNITVPALQSTDNETKWTALDEVDLEVTTSWQTFEIPFSVAAGSDHIGTTQFNINCGQLGTTFYIDDLSLTRFE